MNNRSRRQTITRLGHPGTSPLHKVQIEKSVVVILLYRFDFWHRSKFFYARGWTLSFVWFYHTVQMFSRKIFSRTVGLHNCTIYCNQTVIGSNTESAAGYNGCRDLHN
jgi:hypothetical protein